MALHNDNPRSRLQRIARRTTISESKNLPQGVCNVAVLNDLEIQQALSSLPGWERNGIAIQRVFQFPDFKAAMAFVNKIAEAAEQANHHPDIDIRYNKVVMALVSHDSGGVTQRDIRMAGRINQLAP